MEIYAHRGNSGEAPENTLAAFRQVQDTGADGVEFDVQLSRDGAPVVIHDERLERTTTGKGWVRDHTLAELKALDVGRWFAPAFAGERIPALGEVLELFRGTALRIHVELKTRRFFYPGLARLVIDHVRHLGLGSRVVVSSFNHTSLAEARALDPDLEYAVLSSDPMLEPWRYVREHGFQGFHPSFTVVDEALVRGCHGAGLRLRPWVVDDPADAARMEALGVDGIYTNHPRRFAGRERRSG
jgi:glycerophosphoryl diester phosphodiesterase